MNVSNKSLVITLALSIGLNVFLGSFIAARVLHRRVEAAHESGDGPFLGPRGLMRDRNGPAADKVRDLMRRQGETFRSERGRLRDAQRAVGAALSAEPFDAAALTHAFGELRASTVRSQELMHAALVELARDLPVEQRRELARGKRGFGHGMAGRGGF